MDESELDESIRSAYSCTYDATSEAIIAACTYLHCVMRVNACFDTCPSWCERKTSSLRQRWCPPGWSGGVKTKNHTCTLETRTQQCFTAVTLTHRMHHSPYVLETDWYDTRLCFRANLKRCRRMYLRESIQTGWARQVHPMLKPCFKRTPTYRSSTPDKVADAVADRSLCLERHDVRPPLEEYSLAIGQLQGFAKVPTSTDCHG